MEFRIFGPLEVVADGRVARLNAAKPRALLAILLLRAGEPIPSDRLIEDLWAGRPPATAAKVLRTYVSQLRKALGDARDRHRGRAAYELRVEPDCLDLHRFERLVTEARVAEPPAAAQSLREALALWRGPPLAEFAYEPWAQPEIDRLEELRLEALQERIESDLALGASAELVAELELLVGQYPLREGLRVQLMLALYRSGRQAEALAAYRDARRALVETLGIEPALALRQLERAILDQDPALVLTLRAPDTEVVQRGPSLTGRSSSFVGRTRELREIRALLLRDEMRLLTLTGAAGSGKTRLALEVTGGLEGEHACAVVVELGRIRDARLVARAIVGELGIQERSGRTAREELLEYLRDRQALLLLDNFEHVLSAAPLVRELLAGAPGVKVLATSRAPLGVPEERVYRVPALELPDPSRRTSIARLRRTEAVRLFVDRARAARPDFELSETNAGSVVELCVRLDGLPLALELAAARSNLLSPRALLERLDSRLDLLRAAPGSGLTERQWTLRGAIEWSYELLEPAEQQLFTSLAVFVGGFTLGAAELVAEQPDLDILEAVEALLRNNLLATERSTQRRASPGNARDHPRVRSRSSGGSRRRRDRTASARRLLRRAIRGGRAGPGRPTATRVARASRRRAGQHPRRAHLGGGYRRGGRRSQDRRGALALLAAAEPRARGARAPGGAACARLRLARDPRECANHDSPRWRSIRATLSRPDRCSRRASRCIAERAMPAWSRTRSGFSVG